MSQIVMPELVPATFGVGLKLKTYPLRQRPTDRPAIGPADANWFQRAAADAATVAKGPFWLPQGAKLMTKLWCDMAAKAEVAEGRPAPQKRFLVVWFSKENPYFMIEVCCLESEEEANNLCSRLRLKDLSLLGPEFDYLCLSDYDNEKAKLRHVFADAGAAYVSRDDKPTGPK